MIPALVAMAAVAIWRLDRQSLWVDEVFSLAATNDLGLSLRSTKGTMAGYYALLWLWTRVGAATWWLRAFSTVGAVVAITLVAAIARRLQPRRVAWVAPLLLVGIPIFAWTATEARSYAWETALVAGCWWLIIRGVEAYEHHEARQAKWWVALAIGCALGPLMHGLFILQVPAFAVVAFLKRDAWRAMMRRILPSVFTAVVPTFVIYQAGGSSMGAAWAYSLPERLCCRGGSSARSIGSRCLPAWRRLPAQRSASKMRSAVVRSSTEPSRCCHSSGEAWDCSSRSSSLRSRDRSLRTTWHHVRQESRC